MVDVTIPDLPSGTLTDQTFIECSNVGDGSFKAEIEDFAAFYQVITEKDLPNGYAGLDASTLLDVNQIPTLIPAANIADGSVDNTEFQFLNGVTSNIQTQLDATEKTANKGAISGYAGLDASQELLLTNFPTGNALEILRRNAANTALEFADVSTFAITSINGDTTTAQLIVGTTDKITVGTAGGTTTINVGTDIVQIDQANTYEAGNKQSFVADASSAAINLNAFLPSSPLAGDIYRTAEVLHFVGSSATDFSLVTETSIQTLTNKTFNLTNNTLSGTTAQFNTALSDDDFATLTNSVTLTNKTLTTPIIDSILDTNSNTILEFTPVFSSVNFITITNASVGTNPSITAAGADTDVNLLLGGKNAGIVNITSDVVLEGGLVFNIPTRVTFTPDIDDAGINVGSFTTDPINLANNGDLYYNSTSDLLRALINGTWTTLATSPVNSISQLDSSVVVTDTGSDGLVTITIDNSANYFFNDTDGFTTTQRIQTFKGSDITSTSNITALDGNFFEVTGTTTINSLTSTNWQSGATITLQFVAALQLSHDVGSDGFLLSGDVNFDAVAGNTITITWNGNRWKEVARSVLPGVTDLNSLTDVTISGTTTDDLLVSDADGAWLNRQGVFPGITGLGTQSQTLTMGSNIIEGVIQIEMETGGMLLWDTDFIDILSDVFRIAFNTSIEYQFTPTTLFMNSNNLDMNAGIIEFGTGNTSKILESAGDLLFTSKAAQDFLFNNSGDSTITFTTHADHDIPASQNVFVLNMDDDSDLGVQRTYGQLRNVIVDPSDTLEDGEMFLSVIKAGALTDYIGLNQSNDGQVSLLQDATAAGDLIVSDRLQETKGTNVTSADAITLGDGNSFTITGVVTINHMINTGWQSGSVVHLIFTAATTVTSNAGSATGAESDFNLKGNEDFVTIAGSTLTLIFDGTFWTELNRSITVSTQAVVKTSLQTIDTTDEVVGDLDFTLPNRPGGFAVITLFLLTSSAANDLVGTFEILDDGTPIHEREIHVGDSGNTGVVTTFVFNLPLDGSEITVTATDSGAGPFDILGGGTADKDASYMTSFEVG